MRMIFGLVLVAGLALAGVAVYMVQGYLGQTQQALAAERAVRAKLGPMVEVYVVNKPLAYGDRLTKEDVQKIYWQQSALPEGTFSAEEVLFPPHKDEPRYILRPLEKFEPLLATKVTEPGEPAGLTSQLKEGMRAFSIKVDIASGVAGSIHPGDRVDVYWTGNAGGQSGELTRLIETSLKVIATDAKPGEELTVSGRERTVIVEVSPEQVARLAQGQAAGRLALSLVGTGESAEIGLVEVDRNSLLGIQEQVVQQAAPARVCTIKTRKGADVVEIPIPCTN
ncbi:Flp pilus assembly protein CpaB [Aliigemmobacter aestuarii]|uniref:Flp pilus assembly protein CpaB n=1 Tax=Aliigemmobacter aestuarii TaxID=1445661 RepID=A0A4S3MLG7_9RHOB|nr:Flp pilus assembly protein CpaB [Gemmobacter aestuarii]THD81584.1 Flp pilus assembly protein CpaB [Gemmobacter aestuarii]